MDRDNFKIVIASGNTSVWGDKNNTSGTLDVIVFRDPVLPDRSDSSDSDSSDDGGAWYVIVNTSNLAVGDMKVIGWAYVPDGNADDLIRTDIAVNNLGRLVNP